MKKMITVISAVLLVAALVFCSCGANEDSAGKVGAENRFFILTVPEKVAPGSTVKAELIIKPIKKVALFDTYLAFEPSKAEYKVTKKTNSVDGLQTMDSIKGDSEDIYEFAAFVATTFDADKTMIYSAEFSLSPDLKSGDTVSFTLSVPNFKTGVDEMGSELNDLSGTAEDITVAVTIE